MERMSRKYFLAEFASDVNKIIKQPLKQTQRIKYTCFDISKNYLIFGAISGGLYIFQRHPCEFLKLVPSKEGAVTHVAISGDEKTVAITSRKGIVVIIENYLIEGNIRYQIYTEHKGHIITTIKWHFNELYCGDNFGKVSVIALTGILSKTIFQNPSAVLMHLDSSIVQLDAFSKFLLVSTRTKTFLCDTEEEQYRQIGKKLREGEYGGCFYTEDPSQNVRVREKEKSIFKILKEDEKFTSKDVTGVKIYCTRPGLRIWEADFAASVVCTYQFKKSINEDKTEVIYLDDDPNLRLKVSENQEVPSLINFGKIIVVSNKFFLIFISNQIFIFDTSITLLFKYKANVKEVKVVNNFIYVWDLKEIKVLALMDLEMLLMKTLAKKQFYLCAEICIKYNEELVNLRLNSLGVLKEKLKDEEILNELVPYLNKIKEKKSSNKIVTVENGHVIEAGCSYDFKDEYPDEIVYNGVKNNNDEINKLEEICLDPKVDPNYVLNILYRQYQVSRMYENLELPQLEEILSGKSLDEIIVLFEDFIKHVSELDSNDNKVFNWCYKQYLNHIVKLDILETLDVDSTAFKYIYENYLIVNSNNNILLCNCTFPLPVAKHFEPSYYDVGCELCKKLKTKDIYKQVPYMYKHFIETEFNHSILPLLVQFSDTNLLEKFSSNFSYDTWEDTIKYLIKIKKNICLNCEKNVEFDATATFKWKDFGLCMVKSIGGNSSVTLMKKYSKYIDNVELGIEFYQACMFTTIMADNDKGCKFIEGIGADKNLSREFDKSLMQYLSNKQMGLEETKEVTKLNQKCSKCDLPLRSFLEDKALVCGHFFHKICLVRNKCYICDV